MMHAGLTLQKLLNLQKHCFPNPLSELIQPSLCGTTQQPLLSAELCYMSWCKEAFMMPS